MDELHFYRGRQGADVAMLMRRVAQKAGKDLQAIGTSATMTTEGSREERKATVARVASTQFGVAIPPTNVVDETLQRMAQVPVPASQSALRQAVEMEPPAKNADAVMNHPLAAWLEEAFGLVTEEGRLVRKRPETFTNALGRLVEESGLPEETCRQRLIAVLEAGSEAQINADQPVFAFRLHQFLSSGSSVYTNWTLTWPLTLAAGVMAALSVRCA